jgi:hypothetical protein
MGIIKINLGTLFLNYYLYGIQKLNCYNHVFKNYLQVLELDLKFVVVWKIKFKCRNPNLGLATKAMACKGTSQEWSLGVTFHAPGSVGKCERMNPHTPKWASTLGVRLPMDFRIFRGLIAGVKTHFIEEFLISLKISYNIDV